MGDPPLQSLKPIEGANRPLRRRLGIGDELLLALLPTAVVLAVLVLVEALSRQRLLFASLASSAFLIYLDPTHGTNRIRTLAASQLLAAALGFGVNAVVSDAYPHVAGGVAMVLTIVAMILLDVVHPPAVATSLAFAFRAEDTAALAVFALAVAMTATLVLLQRAAVWLLARTARR